jgi:hypothetical protein
VQLGLTPNVSLDIHFHRGGLDNPDRYARASLLAFIKSARQWIERRGGQTAVIWVLENQAGVGRPGLHAHLIMHVPPSLKVRFHQLRKRWTHKAKLNANKAGVVNFDPLPALANAKGKLLYMSKDLNPKALPIFSAGGRVHLHDNGKPSNRPVFGKKTGVSRNIDLAARTSRSRRHLTGPS